MCVLRGEIEQFHKQGPLPTITFKVAMPEIKLYNTQNMGEKEALNAWESSANLSVPTCLFYLW